MSRTKPTICFDLDGTLTDPKVGIVRCVEYAFDRVGVEPPVGDLTWCIGPPLAESFERMLGDPQLAQQALHFYRERFADVGLFENDIYAGITPAVLRLAERARLFVATSKPTVYAERIIAHFGLSPLFYAVCGSELDGTRGDKSELLAWMLQRHDLDPVRTVMIGDRRHDIKGARNTGLKSIGVLWGYGTRDELQAAGADALCSQPDRLPSLALDDVFT